MRNKVSQLTVRGKCPRAGEQTIWHSSGSLVSLGHVPTGEQLQLMSPRLIASSKQSCHVGSNSS
mgnify:CR=1 FL=1